MILTAIGVPLQTTEQVAAFFMDNSLVAPLFTTAHAVTGRLAPSVALISTASGVMMEVAAVYVLATLELAQTTHSQRTLALATQTKTVPHANRVGTVLGAMNLPHATTKGTQMDANFISLAMLHALPTARLLQRIVFPVTNCKVAFGVLTQNPALKRTLLPVYDNPNATTVTDIRIVTLVLTNLVAIGANRPLVYTKDIVPLSANQATQQQLACHIAMV